MITAHKVTTRTASLSVEESVQFATGVLRLAGGTVTEGCCALRCMRSKRSGA